MKLAALVGLVLAGCSDPIQPPQVLEKPRLLGLGTHVEGSPEVATPAPGESFQVSWLATSPEGPLPVGFRMLFCEPVPISSGVQRCAGEPLAVATSPASQPSENGATFTLPEDYAASEALILATFCTPGGVPVEAAGDAEWPRGQRCPEGEPLDAELVVSVAGQQPIGPRPDLARLEVQLGSEDWPVSDLDGRTAADDSDCDDLVASGTAVRFDVPGDVALTLDFSLARSAPTPTPHDSWQVGTYSAVGELERAFSWLEATSDESTIELDWELDRPLPPEGLLTRLYITVRDGRGAVSWTERSACLYP